MTPHPSPSPSPPPSGEDIASASTSPCPSGLHAHKSTAAPPSPDAQSLLEQHQQHQRHHPPTEEPPPPSPSPPQLDPLPTPRIPVHHEVAFLQTLPTESIARTSLAMGLIFRCILDPVYTSLDHVPANELSPVNLGYAHNLLFGIESAALLISRYLESAQKARQEAWESLGGKGEYDQLDHPSPSPLDQGQSGQGLEIGDDVLGEPGERDPGFHGAEAGSNGVGESGEQQAPGVESAEAGSDGVDEQGEQIPGVESAEAGLMESASQDSWLRRLRVRNKR
ncbi:hypothetical protein LTR85_004925 [Meristemomyces frigidus]|nr:hypothetical protein LTR85_004925 [Meristemomyces frigidus]